MIGKSTNANSPANWTYRWTQIIGTTDEDVDKLSGFRTLTIANDDLIGPGEVDPSRKMRARVFFVRGVQSVFERTIRIQNTTGWDE